LLLPFQDNILVWGKSKEDSRPPEVYSDNVTCFSSQEWRDEMLRWGINHILVPQIHKPMAERMVAILKTNLKILNNGMERDWKEWLYLLCLTYNTEVHSVTASTPQELML